MHNDFVIVGPSADPAGINGIKTAVEAFTKIADSQSPFISRGDDSGTNAKELAIWKSANITPDGDWYIESGQGMLATKLPQKNMPTPLPTALPTSRIRPISNWKFWFRVMLPY